MGASKLSISLVIVTYAREERLLAQLATLIADQQIFNEIIVVDNGGSGRLAAEATALFGSRINVIRPAKNLGAVGRTLGMLASRGDIVVTIDDDVRLTDPRELLQLKNIFAAEPDIACCNFKIYYEDKTLDLSDWCHPRDPLLYANHFFDTTYISEGACAFRGDLVRRLGAYPLDLFIGQEGVELAARIIDAGFSICYFPSVRVEHAVAHEGRKSGRQFYYNARNIYWIALRCYPLTLLITTIAREWTSLSIFALRHFRLRSLLQGFADALRQTRTLMRQRHPISRSSAQRIRQLNKLKPSVIARLRRVLKSKTLK